MKTLCTIIIMSLMSNLALAGVQDFNTLIAESQQAKKDLTKKLKNNVDLAAKSQKINEPHRRIVFQDLDGQSENVVSPTNIEKFFNTKNKRVATRSNKADMKRVAQELENMKN